MVMNCFPFDALSLNGSASIQYVKCEDGYLTSSRRLQLVRGRAATCNLLLFVETYGSPIVV